VEYLGELDHHRSEYCGVPSWITTDLNTVEYLGELDHHRSEYCGVPRRAGSPQI
jgi:hypothetical protein